MYLLFLIYVGKGHIGGGQKTTTGNKSQESNLCHQLGNKHLTY